MLILVQILLNVANKTQCAVTLNFLFEKCFCFSFAFSDLQEITHWANIYIRYRFSLFFWSCIIEQNAHKLSNFILWQIARAKIFRYV